MCKRTLQRTEKSGRNKCTLIKEKTKEVQENRIEYFKKKGDQQFTEEGRTAEIAVDLMLSARAKMSNNKVNRPEVGHGVVTNWNDTEKIWYHTLYNDDFTIAADSFAVVSVFKTARRRQVEERTRGISAKRTRIRRVPANGYRY